MEHIRYQLNGEDFGKAHHRWVQPPQASYFVTTIDKNGNTNVTPTTMGTCIGQNYFSFTLSNRNVDNWDMDIHPYQEGIKQGYVNLRETPECVISYYGHSLLRESWIAAMPLPYGISEIDVMGLNPLASQLIKPVGISECPVNLEAKVIHTHKLGSRWTHYICEIVAMSVHNDLVEANENGKLAGYGILLADPLFEVFIGKGDTPKTDNWRLEYARLDINTLERCPEDIGTKDHWMGTFQQWIQEEAARGKITSDEVKRALELEQLWAANRDPATNAAVKTELTNLLKKVVM